MKHRPQIPDEAATLPARVVAQRNCPECTEEVVRVGDHWYVLARLANKSVRECSTIDLAEARRTLLHWGFSPIEVFNLTQKALK